MTRHKEVARARETNREPSYAPSTKVSEGAGGRSRWKHRKLLLRASVGTGSWRCRTRRNDTAAERFRSRNRKHARGPGRHGLSRPERNRRRHRRRRRNGNKIRTRGAPQTRQSPACRRKRNLRGKRQDPWRGANDRVRKHAVPTLRTKVGLQNLLQMRADPVRPRCAGRCAEDQAQKPHPTSHQGGRNPRWPAPLRGRNGLQLSVQADAASGN